MLSFETSSVKYFTGLNIELEAWYVKKKLKQIFKVGYISLHQRKIVMNGHKIHYIFGKADNSNVLIVCFSAFSDDKPRYNYMRTLLGIKANKLFILDELGRKDYPGTYYLGEQGDFSYKESVIELIRKIAVKCHAGNNIITVGSSKGGWCSLYYGLRLKAKTIIAGAPQYYLGNYLDCDFHHETFRVMCKTKKDKECLNNLLPDLIRTYESHINILLNYSNREHTYFEHIQYLEEDILKNKNISYSAKVDSYENHSDIAQNFSGFIREKITKNLV